MKKTNSIFIYVLSILLLSSVIYAKEDANPAADVFSSLPLRSMGPAITGGRISDFAVNEANPSQYYVATASGGVWKTDNAGTTWSPIFDSEGSYSIGDVTLDPGNENVVWVGTGENNSQRSVGYGDGVYKSVNGGKSWQHMGLKDSEHIGKIIIDPRDSDVVYVAAQGPLWRSGGDRGVFKTTDGGKNWDNILTISKDTGVNEVVMDPSNPDVLYASSYQRRRHIWTLINGGPESTIYKTVNAGKSWEKIDSGLPSVEMGRIGLAIAKGQPNTIYAIVEAAKGESGFYRSTNGGINWQKQSKYVSGSPQYYQEIVVDPNNPDRVYSLDTFLKVSTDGGKTFVNAGEKNKHVDNHALWINPNNSRHLIVGCDGGVYESWDQAKNWKFMPNLPLTQFYKLTVDNDYPFYNVFGGTQDNASLGAPHRTNHTSGIRNQDWLYTQFGDGFKPVIDPENPNIIYSQYQYGGLSRYDKKSGERIQIQPLSPDLDVAQRWNWNSPLLISSHNNKRLYYASQSVFMSNDQGGSWQAISGDLSRNLDRNKLKVMERVWSVDSVAKNRSTSAYGSIVSLAESPKKQGLLMAGTDDGLIQLTLDNGKNWQQVKWPKKLPKYSYVSDIEASLFNEKTWFATFDNHKKGDFKPYIYMTNNNGKSWQNITGNLPAKGTVYSFVQDHLKADLLFAGTEFGVFFSQNGGGNWVQLKTGIPTIAVRDMEIQRRESDLALASFGRGFYILDDYSALRIKAEDIAQNTATLFPVRRAFQYFEHSPLGLAGKSMLGSSFYTAANPEFGATFSFYINDDFKSLKDKRQDSEKELINQKKDASYPSWEQLRKEDQEAKPAIYLTVKDSQGNIVNRIKAKAKKGWQRISWNLRYPGNEVIRLKPKTDFMPWESPNVGPWAVPGKYQVSLSKLMDGVETQYGEEQSFEVIAIDNLTFPSGDRNGDLEFDLKTNQLAKAINGAQAYMKELVKRLQYITEAIPQTPAVDQSLLNTARNIEKDIAAAKLSLSGDRTIGKRAEPVADTIGGIIGYLTWSRSENTGAVTVLQKQRFKRASEGYSIVFKHLTRLNDKITAMELQLREAGAAWTPGTLPIKVN